MISHSIPNLLASPVNSASRKIQNLPTSTMHYYHPNQATATYSQTTAEASLAPCLCSCPPGNPLSPTSQNGLSGLNQVRAPDGPPLLQHMPSCFLQLPGQRSRPHLLSPTTSPALCSPGTLAFSLILERTNLVPTSGPLYSGFARSGTLSYQSSHSADLGSTVTVLSDVPSLLLGTLCRMLCFDIFDGAIYSMSPPLKCNFQGSWILSDLLSALSPTPATTLGAQWALGKYLSNE